LLVNGRLYRSRDERVIAGVAGGIADYLDVDPSLVRVVWVILALFSGGAFLLVYIVMALVVPEEPWPGTWVAGATAPPTPPPAGDPNAPAAASIETSTSAEATATPSATPGAPIDWQAQREQWRAQRAAWREKRRADRAARRVSGGDASGAGLIFGLILVAVGLIFLVPILIPAFDVGRFWPLILVGLGALLVLGAMRPRSPGP
jgi:phage shock protein C